MKKILQAVFLASILSSQIIPTETSPISHLNININNILDEITIKEDSINSKKSGIKTKEYLNKNLIKIEEYFLNEKFNYFNSTITFKNDKNVLEKFIMNNKEAFNKFAEIINKNNTGTIIIEKIIPSNTPKTNDQKELKPIEEIITKK